MARDDDDFDSDRPDRKRREDDFDGSQPRKKKSNLGLILGILAGVFLLCGGVAVVGGYFAFTGLRNAGEQMQSKNSLLQIGLACHTHHDSMGFLPANLYEVAPGPIKTKPLLSWRVQILPYLGEDNLFKKFKMDEAWDGPNNKRLLAQMPAIYATPAERASGRWGEKTYYRGFSNSGAVFEKDIRGGVWRPNGVGPSFHECQDGLSNTIFVVEAGEAVEWTKPDDLDAGPDKPFPKLGGVRPESVTILILMCDGQVKPIKRTMSETTLRALISYKGQEAVKLE